MVLSQPRGQVKKWRPSVVVAGVRWGTDSADGRIALPSAMRDGRLGNRGEGRATTIAGAGRENTSSLARPNPNLSHATTATKTNERTKTGGLRHLITHKDSAHAPGAGRPGCGYIRWGWEGQSALLLQPHFQADGESECSRGGRYGAPTVQPGNQHVNWCHGLGGGVTPALSGQRSGQRQAENKVTARRLKCASLSHATTPETTGERAKQGAGTVTYPP